MTDEISVRGGKGGIRVSITEMGELAELLGRARDGLVLTRWLFCLAQADTQQARDVVLCDYGGAAGAGLEAKRLIATAVVSVEEAMDLRGALYEAVDRLIGLVGEAKANYLRAEAQAAREFSVMAQARRDAFLALAKVSSLPFGPLIGTLLFKAKAAGLALCDVKQDPDGLASALRLHQSTIRTVLSGGILTRPLSTERLTRLITGSIAAVFGDGLAVEVRDLRRRSHSPYGGIEDLMRQIEEVSAPGGQPARVGVSRVTAPDGSISWVVLVPGMRSSAFGTGTDPMDNSSNLRAISGDVSATGLAVVGAMGKAGIGPDQPVLLVGYSQGGLVAASLAANADFTEAFKVSGVVTAGSPVSGIPVKSSVKVLSLEHVQDPIPALDEGPNPDRRNHVTVTRDLTKASDPELAAKAKQPTTSHGINSYIDTGALIDNSGNVSIRDWQAAAAPMLNPEATVELRLFEIKRVGSSSPPTAPGPFTQVGQAVTGRMETAKG
ncbi:MAG: hypothetical protein FWD29_05740 [Micrococcales bacterium]|nr:hypothetical protein [Micrococcales bacterium]